MLLSRTSIEGRILTGNLEVKADVDGQLVAITNEEEIQTHLNIRTAKLDLHLGSQYAFYSDAMIRPLAAITLRLRPKEHAVLQPADGIVFRTREYFRFPRDLSGLVASKVGFTTLGLSPISATIDPTFEGFLIITVWNQSNDVIYLTTDDAIATVSFLQLSEPVPDTVTARSQKGDLFDCVWGSILKDYLPNGSAGDLSEILEEIRREEGLEGKPYQQLYNVISRRWPRAKSET